ncbi:hypothetical protein F5880DRAFT_1514073 [Lentinula raphanica]|nr:hypothetical protein F5880DRAFT_1514073 [Lentinula raphanica]
MLRYPLTLLKASEARIQLVRRTFGCDIATVSSHRIQCLTTDVVFSTEQNIKNEFFALLSFPLVLLVRFFTLLFFALICWHKQVHILVFVFCSLVALALCIQRISTRPCFYLYISFRSSHLFLQTCSILPAHMNIAYLFLALISATYAVPITNDEPQPPVRSGVVIEPRGAAFSKLKDGDSEAARIAAFTGVGLFVGGFMLGLTVNLGNMPPPTDEIFMKKALRSHWMYLQGSEHDETGPLTVNGPINSKFLLVGNTAETREPRVERIRNLARQMLWQQFRLLDREISVVEGQPSANSDLVGVLVNARLRVQVGEDVELDCPCTLWLRSPIRSYQNREPILGLFISLRQPPDLPRGNTVGTTGMHYAIAEPWKAGRYHRAVRNQ